MIYEIEGDIILSRAQVIVQEVAVNDPMTRGLAAKLGKRYPAMLTDFHHWCGESSPEVGEIYFWEGKGRTGGNVKIVSLLTRAGNGNGPARASKLALLQCLRALNKLVVKRRITSIAVSRLCSSAGGLDWYEVRGLIYSQLGDLLIPVLVYVDDRPGQIAFEPGV